MMRPWGRRQPPRFLLEKPGGVRKFSGRVKNPDPGAEGHFRYPWGPTHPTHASWTPAVYHESFKLGKGRIQVAQGREQGSAEPPGCGRPRLQLFPLPLRGPRFNAASGSGGCGSRHPSAGSPVLEAPSLSPKWDHFNEFMARLLGSGDKTRGPEAQDRLHHQRGLGPQGVPCAGWGLCAMGAGPQPPPRQDGTVGSASWGRAGA